MNNTPHILLLPTELLQRVAHSYRVWKLLQLCSRKLYVLLGDYHKHHDIYFYEDPAPVSYDIFVRRVSIYILNLESEDEDEFKLYIMCTGKTQRIPIMTLSSAKLIVHYEGQIYQELARYGMGSVPIEEDGGVCIHNQMYVRERTSCGPIKLLYSWLFNEMPRLYNNVKIYRCATIDDVL